MIPRAIPALLLALILRSPSLLAATAPPPAKSDVPAKVLDDAGLTFNGDIAKALQTALGAGGKATKNTFAVLGIGLPSKDIAVRAPNGWTYVGLKDFSKELTGSAATPRNVLAVLPEFLAKEKPEIVVIIADQAAGRKPSDSEAFDWEDAARTCLRFGALPVLGVSPTFPAADKDAKDTRTVVSEAATAANCPTIDLKAPSQFSKRLIELMALCEEHIFKRAVTAKPTVTPAGGGDE